MALMKVLFVACVFSAFSWGLEGFDRILSDVTLCEEACSKSYSPHTNPVALDNVACARGCRFYSISELLDKDQPDHENAVDDNKANPVKTTCENACVEAYNETSHSTAACKFGCNSQEEKTEAKKKEEDEKPSIHLLSPLMQVHAVYSSFVGAVHIVRLSLVTYFMSDDRSIVAVESEPEIIMEVIPEARDTNSLPEAHQLPRQLPVAEHIEDSSVVRCVSRRLGVPPYLLVASVLGLILFTVYVIFAVCSTASPPRTKNGLSVQADLMPLPVKLVRPEDLTRLSLTEEEDLQAPPLPTKVKLPDSTI